MSKPTVSAAGGAMPAEGHKSRRAALALFAAAPALAILPVVARPPSATQLSALIEAHLAARAAFNEAIDALEAAEPDADAVTPSFDDAAPYRAHQRKDDIAEEIEQDFAAEIKKTATISALSPELGDQARAVLEARKAFCLSRLDEAFADHAVAETAYKEAAGAEDDAIAAIFAHRCATMEEAAAKFRYIKGSPIGDEVQQEHLDALFASFLPEAADDPEGLADV